jgi:hypothetical protein
VHFIALSEPLLIVNPSAMCVGVAQGVAATGGDRELHAAAGGRRRSPLRRSAGRSNHQATEAQS